MISSDIIAVAQWWLIIFLIGIAFLPLTVLLFSNFFDKGYIFSKLLGIAIASYAVFFFGITHIVQFSQISAIFITILVAAVITYFLPLKWSVIYLLRHHWRIFIFEELVFLVALFTWSYIHSFNPDIHGLEKYMDYGFINSILRSDYFPPKDMWFTPLSINYYYYGHFITAFLIKISGVAPTLAFNIMLATIFAFCLSETFSIGANLFAFAQKNLTPRKYKLRILAAGLLTAMLATFAGNLHIIYTFFGSYPPDNPKPIWQLPFMPSTFPNEYWYPNATRFIYHTIHEFPIYSWVVADLHGHVLDIPFVLLIIALLLMLFITKDPASRDETTDEKWKKSWFNAPWIATFKSFFILHPLFILLLGFLLAIMYMTNAWDAAIYILLITIVTAYLLWERMQNKSKSSFLQFFARLFAPILTVISVFIIFAFPYNYFFKPFASGIGVLCAPGFLTKVGHLGPILFEADHCQHSYLWEFLMLYGFFYFFVGAFIVYLSRYKKILRVDIFIYLLIILSTFLIILPEFVYVKDIYPAHYRANTMFKLVFQAFIMLSITSAYIFFRIMKGRIRFIFLPLSVALISLVMMYPYFATKSYYGDLKTYKGLDGTKYLQVLYPSDYEGILWLNRHVKGTPVILEAQGDSYTDYARVSANTGLPTVLGWTVHEWLWRGGYDVPAWCVDADEIQKSSFACQSSNYPAPRINEVKEIYESRDLGKAKGLLKKYKVEYIFIGTLESQKYPGLFEAKFASLGAQLVLQKGNTRIYKINF